VVPADSVGEQAFLPARTSSGRQRTSSKSHCARWTLCHRFSC